MAKLARPKTAPRKIPLWAWHLNAWLSNGKKGHRPKTPRPVPAWFWLWRLYRLARVKRKGSKAWKRYLAATSPSQAQRHRAAIVKHAKWGNAHTTQMHYTEDERRDDWLVARNPNTLPQYTDCSGFGTECAFAAKVPDPNGLDYRYLGYTGTVLENAAKHGTVTTDVSKALPGDTIVIGPGTGWHEVVCVEAGKDPLVATHGGEGVQIQRLSVDTRVPKRVCQVLPKE